MSLFSSSVNDPSQYLKLKQNINIIKELGNRLKADRKLNEAHFLSNSGGMADAQKGAVYNLKQDGEAYYKNAQTYTLADFLDEQNTEPLRKLYRAKNESAKPELKKDLRMLARANACFGRGLTLNGVCDNQYRAQFQKQQPFTINIRNDDGDVTTTTSNVPLY